MTAAVKAGAALGEDLCRIERWRKRSEELRKAALDHFWDETQQRFTGSYKGERWTLFPTMLIEPDEPKASAEVDYLLQWLFDQMTGEEPVLHYTALTFVSVCWFYRQTQNEDGLAAMREIISDFLHWIPSPDTNHLGEWSVLYDNDADGFAETVVNEVCVPHVWNQAINYLAAVLAFGGKPVEQEDDQEQGDDHDDLSLPEQIFNEEASCCGC